MSTQRSTLLTLQDMRRERFPVVQVTIEDASLVVEEGPHKGLSLPLDREIIRIGRGNWCDLVLLHDPQVSKEHCELQIEEEGIRVRELGSRNGAFINGVRVVEAFLQPGSRLRIGNSVLKLQSHARHKQIELQCRDQSDLLVGQSPAMRKIFAQIARLGSLEIPVLLTGETGTGKTTMARSLHQQSPRRNGPFVVVNCGALSPSLVESLLFGYEKGAFTGAEKRHRGYFEQAHRGTLFLDELGELPASLQPKLLDVLERQRIQPLGSEQEVAVDVRLLASTHRNLVQEVEAGRFRQDLYYRLAVVEINIPPLRERPEDIPLLAGRVLAEIDPSGEFLLTDQAIQALQQYLWPGNVRQLYNVLRRAAALTDTATSDVGALYIGKDDLYLPPVEPLAPEEEEHSTQAPPAETSGSLSHSFSDDTITPLKELLETTERRSIEAALAHTGWNVSEAAEHLKISRAWLHRRIKKYNLTQP